MERMLEMKEAMEAAAEAENAAMREKKDAYEQAGCGIYRALANVTASIGAVGKNKEMNAAGVRYNFRGIDDIYNAVNKALGENQVFCLPHVLSRETFKISTSGGKPATLVILRMRYVFCHADGSSVACEVIGEAQDNSDKGTNKAMSIAHKYAIMQMFCIPTEEMAEPDNERVEIEIVEERPKKEEPRKKPDAPKRQLTEEQTYFVNFMNRRHNHNQRAIKNELSDFFGRNVMSILDLTDEEQEHFLEASEERTC